MKVTLSDKLLRAKGEPHEDLWDTRVPGLQVRVGKHGNATLFAVGRQRRGSRVPIRLKIGRYPIPISLADGRVRATTMLRDPADGIDPRVQRAEQKQAAIAKQASLFSIVAEDFIRRHVASKRTARSIELRIRNYLIKSWENKPIAEIKRVDVVAMVEAVVDEGCAQKLFRWAVTRGLLERAPTDFVNITDLAGPHVIRRRVLNETENIQVWLAGATTPYPFGPYVQLLQLLGVRRNELAYAVWDEIDLDRALWGIPAERMKTEEGFAVPLSLRAVEILFSLPRFETCSYVFTTCGNGPLASSGHAKNQIDKQISGAIASWTFHDLRRTFRTGLSTLGIAPHIAELCIAHRQPGLMRTYDLYKFLPEKRHALNTCAAHLLSIVEPPSGKVVPFWVAAAS